MWQKALPVSDHRSTDSSEYSAATCTSPSATSRALFHPRGAPVGMTSGCPSGHGGAMPPFAVLESVVTVIGPYSRASAPSPGHFPTMSRYASVHRIGERPYPEETNGPTGKRRRTPDASF